MDSLPAGSELRPLHRALLPGPSAEVRCSAGPNTSCRDGSPFTVTAGGAKILTNDVAGQTFPDQNIEYLVREIWRNCHDSNNWSGPCDSSFKFAIGLLLKQEFPS